MHASREEGGTALAESPGTREAIAGAGAYMVASGWIAPTLLPLLILISIAAFLPVSEIAQVGPASRRVAGDRAVRPGAVPPRRRGRPGPGLLVHLADRESDVDEDVSIPTEHEVEVLLESGRTLRGLVSYLRPLERSRLVNALNETVSLAQRAVVPVRLRFIQVSPMRKWISSDQGIGWLGSSLALPRKVPLVLLRSVILCCLPSKSIRA